MQPLKWHGGKGRIAGKIIDLMPPHLHYVEPYAGGLAVLLAKSGEGVSEVVNDLHGDLCNFWRVLACDVRFAAFNRIANMTPVSEDAWNAAQAGLADRCDPAILSELGQIKRAVDFMIYCRQSMSGRMEQFTPITRRRVRRGMNDAVAAWLSAVDGLPAIHARLRRVVVLNHDAIDVIRQQDGPQTLFYCDPPYLDTTRTAPDVYRHEMTVEQHVELLTVLRSCAGKVMLSGYRNELYDVLLTAWHRHDFDLPNNSAKGDVKQRRIESLWCNFE